MTQSTPHYIFGKRPVREFLKKGEGESIQRAWVTENCPSDIRSLLSGVLSHASINHVKRKDLDNIIPGVNHQGVAIQVRETSASSDGDWRKHLRDKKGMIVLLERIQDPHNLGSIVRTSEALGVSAVFITGQGAKPGATSERVSAGASFHIPQFVVSNADNVIAEAKENGYWVCVSSAPEDLDRKSSGGPDTNKHKKRDGEGIHVFANELQDLPEASQIVLVIGSEGEGARQLVMRRADYFISVRLNGKTSSLNAGVAAGILIDRIMNRT